MDLKELQRNWNAFGQDDPLWAILTQEGLKGNKWNEKDFFNTGKETIQHIFEFLHRLNVRVHYGSALDFGCGVGRLSQPLALRFEQVSGVDIAASMIDLAVRHNQYPDRCTYYLNTVNNLNQFDNEQFDFILSLLVLQHMKPEYAKNYIKEFVRILKPGGILFFQLPTTFVYPGESMQKRNLMQKIKSKLKRWGRNIRQEIISYGRQTSPIMEMYGIPEEEMTTFLNTLDVEILNIVTEKGQAMQWNNNQYILKKG